MLIDATFAIEDVVYADRFHALTSCGTGHPILCAISLSDIWPCVVRVEQGLGYGRVWVC